MTDPATYRPVPGSIPAAPGVYRFRDDRGRALYVGKAKDLRRRLAAYFSDPEALHPRTRQLVTSAVGVDWTVVRNEVEALQFEYAEIKALAPRFNISYRDDKSYPWLAVSLWEEVPRLQVTRDSGREGVRYFGPYPHAWAIRETLDLLLHVFPARTCSRGVYAWAERIGRPCLLGYIGKCRAPCVGWVSVEAHRRIVEDFCRFMDSGSIAGVRRRLERDMEGAAATQQFERAARLRDEIDGLQKVIDRQALVLGERTDLDVVALAQNDLDAAVHVFHVRRGRVRGERGWVVSERGEESGAQLIERFLIQLYAEDAAATTGIPREVLVSVLPADPAAVQAWLGQRRGRRVAVRVPLRGGKRALLDTAVRNASGALARRALERSADQSLGERALAQLQEALELPALPRRVEAFDVSRPAGSPPVAAVVVFSASSPRRAGRRFAVRDGSDDDDGIAAAIRRRFKWYLDQQIRAGADADAGPAADPLTAGSLSPDAVARAGAARPHRVAFASLPDLVVVSGGLSQATVAGQVLDELGIEGVATVAASERSERVWRPGRPDPIQLSRASEARDLLQRLSDQARRCALDQRRPRQRRRSGHEGG